MRWYANTLALNTDFFNNVHNHVFAQIETLKFIPNWLNPTIVDRVPYSLLNEIGWFLDRFNYKRCEYMYICIIIQKCRDTASSIINKLILIKHTLPSKFMTKQHLSVSWSLNLSYYALNFIYLRRRRIEGSVCRTQTHGPL